MMRRFLTQTIAKIRNLRRSQSLDEELEREIALHAAMLEEEYEQRGMSPEEAHRAARQALGGVEQVKQAHRDQRGILWLEQTRQDLRHACRTFGRNPGFTLVAVATLAVGIGVNTTLFTAYDAVALKPLPHCRPGTSGAARALVHPRVARRHAIWVLLARVSLLSRASGRILGRGGYQLACARTCSTTWKSGGGAIETSPGTDGFRQLLQELRSRGRIGPHLRTR